MTADLAHVLIESLERPECYDHPVGRVQLIETHISWVLLTGPFAYKIKKPVDLGFLDFSTLDERRRLCHEELRLNRRTAPELYLEVVALAGSPHAPRVVHEAAGFEYALKMRQFEQDARLDHVLAQGLLMAEQVDQLAAEVARLHASAAVAAEWDSFGNPQQVFWAVADLFKQIRSRTSDAASLSRLVPLEDWFRGEHVRLRETFARRKQQGFVRECHGDLHLANMVLLQGRVRLFDCLEFSERLRWIDVASDVAFAVMDLADRGRPDFAWRLLGQYLDATGDFAGLCVLPYYLFYRAMVRAAVASIRGSQADADRATRDAAAREFGDYLALAERYTRPGRRLLLVTHGVSGSGKTTHTQPLLEALCAVRVRSDVERKRLFGLAPDQRPALEDVGKLYGPAAGQATYDRLEGAARTIIEAGFPAIVDATFLRRRDRTRFRELAERLGVPFVILDFAADEATLRERVAARAAAASDASDATLPVLESQLRAREPLAEDELPCSVHVETAQGTAVNELLARTLEVANAAAIGNPPGQPAD